MMAQEKEIGDIPELFIVTVGFITIARCSGKAAFHWVVWDWDEQRKGCGSLGAP